MHFIHEMKHSQTKKQTRHRLSWRACADGRVTSHVNKLAGWPTPPETQFFDFSINCK